MHVNAGKGHGRQAVAESALAVAGSIILDNRALLLRDTVHLARDTARCQGCSLS